MLDKKTIEQVFELNHVFTEKTEDLYGFTYETNGWYECIKFNEHVLWDSEDCQAWLSERPDSKFDTYDIANDYDEDIIGCVKRRFNDFVNLLKECRYDVKSKKSEKTNAFDTVEKIFDDLTGRKGFHLDDVDVDIQQEIFDTWVNIVEKYN